MEYNEELQEFRLMCDECDTESYVFVLDESPEFCPCCGRRAEPYSVDDMEWAEEED